MTIPLDIKRDIILDMSDTIQQQKKIKEDRWNGYNVRIIKDVEDSMQRLNEILVKRKMHQNMLK